ncbi:hypothetical protein FSP39_011881 [Pinctada imbricata]|uniref:Nuclear receptor coactivator 6 TRADD-N domain-containing protein n=1 Tax=Pinctada imbricata TaxID=66713 RepID=A0AA88XYI7_PINIB|nr:hypothetical protein FSP39_011881 [Pinctada imbricata]
MGPQEDYVETVFTCEGDINDPNLQTRLEDFKQGLRDLLSTDKKKLILKKVEPWNSVRVTFKIPLEAARRLKQLAQQGNASLRQLGVLAVQLEGDQLISLTIAGRNNEPTQLIFRTSGDAADGTSVTVVNPNARGAGGGTVDLSQTNNGETTQKNIAQYLRQGPSLFDSILQSTRPSALSTADAATNQTDSLSGNTLSDRSILEGEMATGVSNNRGIHGINLNQLDPAEFPQIQGMLKKHIGLPPPPPYPGGSSLLNNLAKATHANITSTASPLLVNLLQTDPQFAGIASLVNSKMLPPSETSPQPKKKRKPRKPRDKNKQLNSPSDGEIPIQSVPNPAHDSYTMNLPLVTSGNSSSMPSIPMVTQALPASSQPSVTFSSQGKHASPSFSGLMHHDISRLESFQSKSSDIPTENTSGKIINPYTGLLEPMESSDSSPSKSDTSVDGFSPHKIKLKRSPKDKNLHRSALSGRLSTEEKPSKLPVGMMNSLTACSTSNQYLYPLSSSLQAEQSVTNSKMTFESFHSSEKAELFKDTSSSASLSVHNSTLHSSDNVNIAVGKSSLPPNTVNTYLSTVTNPHLSTCSAQVSSVASTHPKTICHVSSASTSHNFLDFPHSRRSPEHLLNEPLYNPAKTASGSPVVGSPDSENSSQSSLLHDSSMQNDIGAVPHGSILETKAYNHDSGVGSSSERSDDTPSEPGDSEFRSGQPEDNLRLAENLSKEIIPKIDNTVKTFNEKDVINAVHRNGKPNSISASLQNLVSKQNLDITVGYAMSNSNHAKSCDSKSMADINSIMATEKSVSEHFLKRMEEKSHINNTILHWSSKQKTSPRLHESGKGLLSSRDHLMERSPRDDHLNRGCKIDEHSQGYPNVSPQISMSKAGFCDHSDVRNPNRLSPYTSSASSRTPSPRIAGGVSGAALVSNSTDRCNSEIIPRSLGIAVTVENQYLSQMKYSKSPEGKSKSPTPSGSVPPLVKKNSENLSAYEKLLSSKSNVEKNGHNLSSVNRNENTSKFPISSATNGPIEVNKNVNVTSMYKRKSPVSGSINSVPHNFFDPHLPIPKKLTESVQKLVKPLLAASDSSSLPHSQRKSPVSASKLHLTSSPPRQSKGSGTKSPTADTVMEKQPGFSDSVMIGQNMLSSDIPNTFNAVSDHYSSQGIESSMLSALSHHAELPLLQLENSHTLDLRMPPLIPNHVGGENEKLSSDARTHLLGSLLKQTNVQKNLSDTSKTSMIKESFSSINCKDDHDPSKAPLLTTHTSQTKDSHKQTDKIHSEKIIISPNEDGRLKSSGSSTTVKNVQQIGPLKIKLTDKKVSDAEKCNIGNSSSMNDSKLLEIKTDNSCSLCKGMSCECGERDSSKHNKNTKHSDLKSPPLKSPTSTDDTIKNALEVIEKSKKELEERKVEVTVVTKAKSSADQKSDKSEPTVPPIILRVRRKSITETSENGEESQSKMTLRTSRGSSKIDSSDTSPTQPIIRQQKTGKTQITCETTEKCDKTLQADKEREESKTVIEEDSSKRNLRKRKTLVVEQEVEAKKAATEEEVTRQTRSSDVKNNDIGAKIQKSDSAIVATTNKIGEKTEKPAQSEIVENDVFKTTSRNREKPKAIVTEEKNKVAVSRDVKEIKRAKSVEEEDCGKRQPSRRNKAPVNLQPEKSQKVAPSPQLNEKATVVNGKCLLQSFCCKLLCIQCLQSLMFTINITVCKVYNLFEIKKNLKKNLKIQYFVHCLVFTLKVTYSLNFF